VGSPIILHTKRERRPGILLGVWVRACRKYPTGTHNRENAYHHAEFREADQTPKREKLALGQLVYSSQKANQYTNPAKQTTMLSQVANP